jgi:apolipoprotein N-acyltransferase
MAWVITILAAAANVAAWNTPGSTLCAALGWSSIALFVSALIPSQNRSARLFVAGCLTYLGGFYWLFDTIKDFGGFPTIAALPIFLLFVVGSAVQFLMWAFIFQNLPVFLARLGLRTSVSWLVAHHFWIKIFPWDYGHTQLAFLPFAQVASVAGVTGITFLMMWIAELICARSVTTFGAKIAGVAVFLLSLIAGQVTIAQFGTPRPSDDISLKTFLIQGNVSLHRKHDTAYFTVNREQYLRTSAQVSERDSLVVWPESTLTEFIPDTIREAQTIPLLPFLNNGGAFLVGGLTFSSRERYFNSSILVRPDGSVANPYHKMILMPFGEYTPLSSLLPFLKDINATAGQFTAGEEPGLLSFKLSNGKEAKVSPLICYEDIVPEISRDAVRMGSGLLINQTNDAWFGDTVAPYQHHVIASFRAIENDRYLLRSTNTGLTAVVDPLGRTLASLLPYTEGVLPMEVSLKNSRTIFTIFPIPYLWLLIAVAGFALTLYNIRRSRAS